MASKTIHIEDLGPVNFYKRRGARNLRVSVADNGLIRVSFPWWVSYDIAQRFLNSKKDWVLSKRLVVIFQFESDQRIGKAHKLIFSSKTTDQIRSKIVNNEVIVFHPQHIAPNHGAVQAAAAKAALRALKIESSTLLTQRLAQLARQHGFNYSRVNFRMLKSRWGSCNTDGTIVLNIYLMQLPWHLIDYVIVHELAHTQAMNHSPNFWSLVEKKMPDFKARRKEIKLYRPAFRTEPIPK